MTKSGLLSRFLAKTDGARTIANVERQQVVENLQPATRRFINRDQNENASSRELAFRAERSDRIAPDQGMKSAVVTAWPLSTTISVSAFHLTPDENRLPSG